MGKKITALLLAIGLIVDLGNIDVYGGSDNQIVESKTITEVSGSDGMYAEGKKDVSPQSLQMIEDTKTADGDFSSAVSISLGNTINGSITETIDNRLYRFSLAKSGRVTIDLSSYMQYCSLYIYGSEGELIWYDEYNKWNENLKYFKDTYEIDLTNGIYFLEVTGYEHGEWRGSTGTYEIATKFTSAGESCIESNNNFMEASVIGINGIIKGQIAENDRYDIYKFSLPKSGQIGLSMTYYMMYNSIYLYDNMGEEIWYSEYNEWNENLKYKTDIYNLDLESGTYYFKVTGYERREWNASTGNYTFKMKYTNANVNYKEPNNDFTEAYTLETNKNLKGQIAINDRYDILKFSLPKAMDVKITMTSYMEYYTLDLYDSAGERIWYTDYNEWNANVGYRKDIHTVTLSSGSYYLKVTGYKYGEFYASTGNYALLIDTKVSIKNATASLSEYRTYTGKLIQPSVTVKYNGTILRKGKDYELSYKNNKSVGTATIVIKGKGNYIGTKKIKFYITPKKATITKAQNRKKRTVTLKWKRDKNVSGYEIYRSVKKNVGYIKVKEISKNKTVSFIDKNLKKGRTYYYKVRSYKKLKGSIYYGPNSKEKAVKIKK